MEKKHSKERGGGEISWLEGKDEKEEEKSRGGDETLSFEFNPNAMRRYRTL